MRIFNKRGPVLAGAVVTEGIIKGTVALHEGAWYDPLDIGQSEQPLCKNGCANVLTMDKGTSDWRKVTPRIPALYRWKNITWRHAVAVTVFDREIYRKLTTFDVR